MPIKKSFWYVVAGRLSSTNYPTKAKARAALRKANEFRGTKGGGIIEAAGDVDAMHQLRAMGLPVE